jgi:N-acetylmuramoyl-L-alanine amidase
MKTVIIDPGHGGIWQGVYCTAGKRSPEIPPGFYEGEQVRNIAIELLNIGDDKYNFYSPILDMPPNHEPDVGLKCRTMIYNRHEADLLLSLHTNAKGKAGKWEPARGTKLFFRGAQPKAARAFLDAFCKVADMPNRGAAKNLTFTILKSKHPAVLIEMGFHTNKTDVEILKDTNRIARGLLAGIDMYFQQ